MGSEAVAAAYRGTLLIADISGYTGFLGAVGGVHGEEMAKTGVIPEAYPLMTTLLEGIVDRLVPPFTLSKTEGDAVFAFASDADLDIRGQSILDCIGACYASFRGQVEAMNTAITCDCNACGMGIPLDLKFVLHHGGYVTQPIAGRAELIGPEVNAVHRLLKNHATDLVGDHAYALLTAAAVEGLQVPADGTPTVTETYDHFPPIEAYVFELSVPV
jgi:hypothetical protein